MTRPGRTLAFGGDLMLGRTVARHVAAHGCMAVWKDVLATLWSADLGLVNLECALTRSEDEWHDGERKAFYFRADPAAVDVLVGAGIDFASLANNHVLDFGVAGLRETIDTLDRAGIAHAGAGMDLASAEAPARLDADGLRVAVVACADHPTEWAAGADRPGIRLIRVGTPGLKEVTRSLARAREDADVVVLSLHWGSNMRDRPSDAFRSFATAAVDAGADIVWGHSAHVVQGIEFHSGRPILYDTGELVDDYAVDLDLRNDLSALFLVQVTKAGTGEVALVPLSITDMCAGRAQGADRRWLVDRITSLCAELGTTIETDGDRLIAHPTARIARRAAGARSARLASGGGLR